MKTNENSSEGNKKPNSADKQERQWQDEFDDTAASAQNTTTGYENKSGIDAPDNNQDIPANQGASDAWRKEGQKDNDKTEAPQVGSESQSHADALQEGVDKAGAKEQNPESQGPEDMSNSQYDASRMGKENVPSTRKESSYKKENEDMETKYNSPANKPSTGKGNVDTPSNVSAAGLEEGELRRESGERKDDDIDIGPTRTEPDQPGKEW